MRKTIFNIVLVLVSMAMLTSCDPSCSEECVVKNQSGHDVVLTRYYCIHSGGWNDWQPVEDSVRTHVDTLKNGSETKYVGGHLGNTCKMCIESTMKREYWGDSVAFAFDDGTIRVFYPDSDTVWGPYAFGSDNYAYQEEPNPGLTFHGDILFSRLTYTLTEEDYERCKGR